MVCPDHRVVEKAGLLLGEDQDPARPVRETLEHGYQSARMQRGGLTAGRQTQSNDLAGSAGESGPEKLADTSASVNGFECRMRRGCQPANWGRRITGITGELRHQAMDEKQLSLCLVPSETRMST